ncbi:unnamed protein product, partial [Scytosiphon promiscuus]
TALPLLQTRGHSGVVLPPCCCPALFDSSEGETHTVKAFHLARIKSFDFRKAFADFLLTAFLVEVRPFQEFATRVSLSLNICYYLNLFDRLFFFAFRSCRTNAMSGSDRSNASYGDYERGRTARERDE